MDARRGVCSNPPMLKGRFTCLAALTIALSTLVCGAEVRAGSLPLDAATAEKMLAAHNDVRRGASPAPAPPLEAFVWSDAAVRVAQAWAERCTFSHNPERGELGENIFATTVTDAHVAVEQAMTSWAAEAKDFDLAKNACAVGAVCGHYTQLVWRATRSVGCAVASCTTGAPLPADAWTLVVCDYAPPGNMAGEKPY